MVKDKNGDYTQVVMEILLVTELDLKHYRSIGANIRLGDRPDIYRDVAKPVLWFLTNKLIIMQPWNQIKHQTTWAYLTTKKQISIAAPYWPITKCTGVATLRLTVKLQKHETWK